MEQDLRSEYQKQLADRNKRILAMYARLNKPGHCKAKIFAEINKRLDISLSPKRFYEIIRQAQ